MYIERGFEVTFSSNAEYSSVLKYRNLITQNKIQNQLSRKLSRIRKFAIYKNFSKFHLAYKNVCLKFLRPILRKF